MMKLHKMKLPKFNLKKTLKPMKNSMVALRGVRQRFSPSIRNNFPWLLPKKTETQQKILLSNNKSTVFDDFDNIDEIADNQTPLKKILKENDMVLSKKDICVHQYGEYIVINFCSSA